MLLKRLEINGFKSFASKTVFEFDTGIVAIVGPNGSGKSNIIDAFRWLLGEREAKNLRGGKGEDLIFAGTPKKPRISQASVSVVFDNTNGILPVDFREVVITRKISRSGVSEYFINDASVRLKDIIDFFSKIRLGSKGLSIIGQGSGDIFVKASPEDRMMMVQEILGLREYELKKLEAQRKLKNTRINMEKIEAMAQEVLPRLRMLKRQTAKWERRSEIEDRLKTLEVSFFPFKIKQLLDAQKSQNQPLPEIEKKIMSAHAELERAQQELSRVEANSFSSGRIEEIQKTKRALFEDKSSFERELYKLEANIEQHKNLGKGEAFSLHEAKEALKDIQEILERGVQEGVVSKISESITQALDRIKKLFSSSQNKNSEETEKLTARKKEIATHIQQVEKNIASIEQEERELSLGVDTFSEKFKEAFGKVEAAKETIQKLEEEKIKITYEKEKIAYRLDDILRSITSSGGDAKEFLAIANSSSFSVHMDEQELSDAEKSILRFRGELASIGEIDRSLVQEAQEVESHYNFLKQELDDLSLASENMETLIQELNQKLADEFKEAFRKVNDAFHTYFRVMFGGGSAKMKVIKKEKKEAEKQELEGPEGENLPSEEPDEEEKDGRLHGLDIEVSIPQKKITNLDMLSGGERSLTSLAVIFALISISPPPFLVLDEADAALDEKNSRRFAELVRNFSNHTQFVVVTHNRVTMEAADVLYGVTMDESGCSKILSLKLTDAEEMAPRA